MRLKPKAWFIIGLLLCAAVLGTWRYAKRSEARRAAREAASAAAQHPGLTPAANVTAGDKSKSYRITNTRQTFTQLLHNSHALILRNALIDTEVPVALKIPNHLRAKGAPGSYLVQSDRPLDKNFYAELAKAGATYISYVPNNAALVQASPTQATNIAANADVVAVLPYEPYYKLDNTLLPSAVEQQSQTNALSVTTFPGQRDAALNALAQLGATLIGEDRSPFGPTLIVRVPPTSLTAVAQLPQAQEIEAYTPRRLMNDLTRVQLGVSTNTLLGTATYLNLSGKNVTVNINDTGVEATNHDLVGRVIGDSLTDNDGHGTHVAGIIAGSGKESSTVKFPIPGSVTNADMRGKATNAMLFSQSLDLVTGPFISDSFLQENASTNLGSTNLISNNSWGYDSASYDSHAASFDAATRDAQPGVDGEQPLLFVFAAGNNGNVSGVVNSPGTGKNVITVAASVSPRNITNEVYEGTDSNQISQVWLYDTTGSNTVADFSSGGNVDAGVEGTFGRFKPDVVAPGSFTISLRSASYVDPSFEAIVTDSSFPFQVVDPGKTNTYPFGIPFPAGGFTPSSLTVVISSNSASPIPFPTNMLLLADLTGPLTTVVSSNNFYTMTNLVEGSLWQFGVAPPSNSPGPVNYNIDFYLYETNPLGDYFVVLSNLNNNLKPYYRYESGTSMSAGAVSGVLALMQEYLQTKTPNTNPSPALMKAMLINGSRSLGQQYDFQVETEGVNEQGWGIPNISNSIPQSLGSNNASMLLVDQSPTNALATGEYQTYQINCIGDSNAVNFPIRISLVWTDPPGNPAAGVALVNNLNLTVVDATGTNIYVGNDFLSGDTFTEVSNPTNLPPSQSDNTTQNIYVDPSNSVYTAVFTTAGDSINNVQNVYISPSNAPIVFPLTITVCGTRVNVNAVTTQTNNILQDYALVVSSDDPALTAPLTISTNQITNAAPVLVTIASNGVPLLHQRVGANDPNLYNSPLGLTNGNASQWHFFVFTNNQFNATNQATNVAFATFLPPNLSIPRVSGSADIDLYVSYDPGLTNLNPISVENAFKSVGRTGTESIIFTNSTANLVYYIGVKSEDQQAADFGFYAIAQQAPFSTVSANGNTVTATGTSLPVYIPNALSPTPALVFAFLFNPNPVLQDIRRVTVTLGIQHPSPNDLSGTLQHDDIDIYLNHNSTTASANGFTNTYDDLQENPNAGTILSDGPGHLTEYVSQPADGLWLLTEADNYPDDLSGYVTTYTVTVDLQQPQLSGFFITIPGQSWFDDYLYVPNDATNMIIYASYESEGTNAGGSGPIGIYLTNELGPILNTDFGSNNIVPPGGSLTLGSTPNPPPGWPPGTPPLSGGYWYYGIYNSNTAPVTLFILIDIEESLTPNVVQTYTNSGPPIPLLTDAHTESQICITNNQQLVSLEVGVCLQDTNTDDLVIHLTSPEGTSVLLFENRGGLLADGLGLPVIVTNSIGTNGVTNYSTNYIYTIFTENTNLTTTPIKFAPPPYATNDVAILAVLSTDSFEDVTNGVYTNGAILDGWLVTNNLVPISTTSGPGYLTNDEVGIVTDAPGDVAGSNNLGTNYLALTSGHIVKTFGTNTFGTNIFAVTNGQPYQLVFYAKPDGIVHWYPGDHSSNDIISGSDLTYFNGVTYSNGEVGDGAFYFNGNSYATTPDAPNFHFTNLTTELWVNFGKYPTNATGDAEFNTFIGKAYYPLGNTDDDSYTLYTQNGVLGGAITAASGSVQVNYNWAATTGVWYHVGFTYNGGTGMGTLYVNGLETATAFLGLGPLVYDSHPVQIGDDFNLGSQSLQMTGLEDEVSFYNRDLSPAEMYAIYHAGHIGKYSTNSLLPNFTLAIDDVSTNNYIFTNASGGWQLFTNTFVATNNQITVEFYGNALGVLLDDIQLVQLPATNYNNYYLPEEPLTPFVGENPLGCWTLDIWDTRLDSPLPDNGTLLSWNLQLTTSSTNATLYVLTNDVPFTNTLPTNSIAYFGIDVPYYASYATNILTSISGGGPLTLLFNQNALPTGNLPGDRTFATGVFDNSSTNIMSTSTLPTLLPGQRYFLGVLNNGSTPAVFDLEVQFNVTTNIVIALTNDIPFSNIVGSNAIGTNGPQFYSFIVPTNAIMATFQILNATNGEVDLYAREGLPLPGPNSFDYESDNSGPGDQFIVVTTNSAPVPLPVVPTNDVIPLSPTIWYLGVYNNQNLTNLNYTIVASYVLSNQMTIIPLTNAIPFTNTAAPGYPSNLVYSFSVTNYPGSVEFTVTNLSGVGNVQLLANLDSFPTPEAAYIGSFNTGTTPQFITVVPSAQIPSLNGIWYLSVPNTSQVNVKYSITAYTNYVAPPALVPITWSGAIDDLWDVLATSNWVVTANHSIPYPFQNGSIVTFDDSAVGPTTIELTTAVTVGGMTNNNNSLTYDFIGSGSITSPYLIKKGAEPLIFDNSTDNNFGSVDLVAGTIQIGNNDANGSLGPGGLLGSGSFFDTAGAVLNISRSDNPTINNVISGGGNVWQTGTGTLTIAGINSYSGLTAILAGRVVVDNTNALGSWTGSLVEVVAGATLDLSGLSVANGPALPLFGPKPFFIQGAGTDGTGVIVNNGLPQQAGFESISLGGDSTIGGSAEWDLRGGGASLGLNSFTLTKTGANIIRLVSANISSGNIVINQGILSIEGTPVFASGFGTITVSNNALVGQNLDTLGSFTAPIILDAGGTTNVSGGGVTYLDAPIDLATNGSFGNGAGLEIFNGIISGGGALTNLGYGSNTLSATNIYTGPTIVAQGSLGLTNTGTISNTISITVTSNGTFDASQRIDQTLTLFSNQTLYADGTNLGNVLALPGSIVIGNGFMATNLTLQSNSILTPGPDGVTIGTLTVSNIAALGGTNYMKINETLSPSNDMLTAGAVVYGGTLIVTNVNTDDAITFVAGDSFLLYNTSNSSGAFGNIVLPPLPAQLAWTNTFAISGPGILTVVTNPNYMPPFPIVPLTWVGAYNGNWDILTTSNWVVTTNVTQLYAYEDGSPVTFDDTAYGPRTIDLTTALSPASVVVSNFLLPYVFTGSGGISGAPLTVDGTLTLDNPANRFSSVTLNSGGTLQLGNDDTNGALATSTGILGAGTFTNNGTLIFARSDIVVVTNVITGTGAVTQDGLGLLALTTNQTYTGPTTVAGGILSLQGASIGNSQVTVSPGAILENGSTNAAAIGGDTTFDSGATVILAALGGTPPAIGALNITGSLSLSNTAVIVNVVTGPPLQLGTYLLMNCTGTLTGSPGSVTVTGVGVAAGYAASVMTVDGSGGYVSLVISGVPGITGVTNQTMVYGTTNIILTGTISGIVGSATNYAQPGDSISATINGFTVNGTVTGPNGAFTINYNDPSLATDLVINSPYTIGYSYGGNTNLFLAPANNSSTTLTITPLPTVLAGSRLYDGTANANANILTVINAINGDDVTVASGVALLASTNAGIEPIISMGTLTLGGPAAANYTLVGGSGTVTIVANPPLVITSSTLDNTGKYIIITWQSVPGTVYQVIANTNVGAPLPAWTNVGSPVTAVATNTSATNPIDEVWNFFEVKNAGASGVVAMGPFPITSSYIDSTGTNIVITWQSVPNAVYRVVSSSIVNTPVNTWKTIGNSITATNSSTTATNPITMPLEFFKVVSP